MIGETGMAPEAHMAGLGRCWPLQVWLFGLCRCGSSGGRPVWDTQADRHRAWCAGGRQLTKADSPHGQLFCKSEVTSIFFFLIHGESKNNKIGSETRNNNRKTSREINKWSGPVGTACK